METKFVHTTELLRSDTNQIIELFFGYAQLKNLYRQGWLERGIPKLDCETDADHCFGVALLAYVIAEEYRPDLDISKVIKLSLIHEIGEIYAGDIKPSDGVSLEEKSRREFEAVNKVFSKFPNPDKYINLWKEYDAKKTPEAIFVAQIDKLETALQANLYERLNYGGLDEFFPYVNDRLSSPELRKIFDDLVNTRK